MAAEIIKGAVQVIKMIKESFEQKKFNTPLTNKMFGRLDFINQMLETLIKAEGIDAQHTAITNL